MTSKPWFQQELERETKEHWRVTTKPTGISVTCSHGMSIFVPFPPGLDRAFLNDTAEARFVGKVLVGHRPWADKARHYNSPAWKWNLV